MNDKNNIINGKYYAQQILAKLAIEVEDIRFKYHAVPSLAIILVGNDPASMLYIRNKLLKAKEIGIKALQISLAITITTEELLNEINKLNNDPGISGIIVQLPLPAHIDQDIILAAIAPHKDIDGFHPMNIGYLHSGINKGFIPCTALGCLELIKNCEPLLAGKNAVIVGRSNIVGKPVAALLLKENCTVTICHSKTRNLDMITSKADIVIVAVGSPYLLGAEYFHSNAIVIDVGINRLITTGKLVGDVNFEVVQNKVKYITPVPGGVGPMTIAFLLANVIASFYKL